MIRAQLAANPLKIAKALVVKKFEHMRAANGLTIEEASKFIAEVRKTKTIADIMRVEGRAGDTYWARYQCELRPRGRASSPYKTFRSRKGASNTGARNATHPVNALLNMAYEITAGRLGVLLAAAGFATAIGFLHSDRKGRHSLVYDVIEPLRPIIDKRVFAWIADNRFSKSDFIHLKDPSNKAGIIRIAPSLRRVFASETAVPQSDLIEAVEFMRGLILPS
jgi:CRISPR-associated protein Cas1